MKKSLIPLAAIAFILPISAFAEVLHQGTASIGYAVRDQEMIVRGSTVDGDYTGTQLAASFLHLINWRLVADICAAIQKS